MNGWARVRAWMNRDNGKMLHIGNRRLNIFELLGYLLFVLALIIYLLHDKTGFGATWIGWVSLFAGAVMVAISAGNANGDDEGDRH